MTTSTYLDKTFPDSEILVSAIVSTYSSEKFIAGCLEDLISQTLFSLGLLEIIVVDSASPQNEGVIVKEFCARHGDRIRYIRTSTRETVYAAWNRGIALARGRYITNANTDDRHRRDAFETMAGILDNDASIDLVYADVLITETPNETFEQNTATGRYMWFPWDRNILLDRGCFIGPQPMWRRILHELYGGFAAEYVTSGDYEFWLRISQTSDFYYIEEPLGLYLKHADSIEHRNEQRKFSENREILSRYHQAAAEGHIVGFLPFTRLADLIISGDATPSSENLRHILDLIDRLVTSRPQSDVECSRRYAEMRDSLCAGKPVTRETLQQLTSAAELALLNGRDWFVARKATIAIAAADRRSKLLDEAVQDAHVSLLRGNVDAAVDILLKRGVAIDPKSPLPYLELAETLVSAKRWADALQVVSEMPESTDPAVRHGIEAVCHSALGDDAAAARAAECAHAAGTELPRVLVVLGTLAARHGKIEKAEALFGRAIDTDPACAKAWLSLGMILWGKGCATDAWDAVLRAVRFSPTDQEVIGICLDMARRCGRTEEAAKLFRQGITQYPDCRDLAAATCELLLECGHPKEALDEAKAYLVRATADDDIIQRALEARKAIGPVAGLAAEEGTISLCMIVKNEEQVLARCLASVEPLVHEMVVVDTGSTDRTVAIATVFGARVFHFAWNGNFSDARNFAIEQARGRWILVLDADEVISAKDHPEIQELVKLSSAGKVAFSVVTRNYTGRVNAEGWTANDGQYPNEEAVDGWCPSWKVRLFPNMLPIRFRGKVHELVEPSLRGSGYEIRNASFPVHHYGQMTAGIVGDKQQRYLELGRKKLAENPTDLVALRELAIQTGEMGLLDEALELWNRALAIKPDLFEGWFNKSYVLIGLKQYQEALEAARRAFSLDPRHREAAFNYGTCELYVGSPTKVLEEIEPLFLQDTRHPQLLALMTMLYLASGNTEKAKETSEQLQSMNYDFGQYFAARISTLKDLDRMELAEAILRHAEIAGLKKD